MSHAIGPEATRRGAGCIVIDQLAHGLTAIGTPIRLTASGWAKAKADSPTNAAAHAVVGAVFSDRSFLAVFPGGLIQGLSGLTAGATYYLDAATAGAVTATPPAIAVPVYHALSDSAALVADLAATRRSWTYAWQSDAGAITFPDPVWPGDTVHISARLRQLLTTGPATRNLFERKIDIDLCVRPVLNASPPSVDIEIDYACVGGAFRLSGSTSFTSGGVAQTDTSGSSTGSFTVLFSKYNATTGLIEGESITISPVVGLGGTTLAGFQFSGASAPYLQCVARK